jgi:hypothetical protein
VAQHARAEAPAARYADAGHFADDLRRALDGQPVSVRPEDTVERLGRLARRHPRTVAAAVLASLALSLVVAGAAAVTSRSRAQLVEQMASHLEERGEEALRRGLEPEALAAAQEAQALRPSARTRGLLAALGRRAGVSAEIVGDEGCATAAVGAGAVRACVGDGVLWLERPGAARVRLAEVGERELVAEVLPGGGVLVGREGAQHAFELLFFGPSGERLGAAQPPNGGRVSWTPFEGGALAGLADDLVLYDAGGQERARRRPCGPVPLHGAVTAPGHDGRGAPWVVCQGQRLREVFGEREVPVPATLRGPTAAVHVGAGQVLVGTAHGRLGLLSLHTGAVGLTLEGGLGAVRRLRALDEATVLVVGEKGVGLWQTALSAWLHVEHRPAPFNAGVADGRVLLWGERERTRWTLPQSAPLAALAWSEGVSALAVSPDGEWLALGSGEGVVRLASVRTGALTLHGAATTQVVKGLAFSPDGRQLAVASSGPLGLALLPVPTLAPARTVAQSSRGVAFLADDELLTFVWSGVHFRWPCSLAPRAPGAAHGCSPSTSGCTSSRDGLRGARRRAPGTSRCLQRAGPSRCCASGRSWCGGLMRWGRGGACRCASGPSPSLWGREPSASRWGTATAGWRSTRWGMPSRCWRWPPSPSAWGSWCSTRTAGGWPPAHGMAGRVCWRSPEAKQRLATAGRPPRYERIRCRFRRSRRMN